MSGSAMASGCQQHPSGVLVVRAQSCPGKMPGLFWAEVFREASTQCHSVHLLDARVEQARCGFLLVSGDAGVVWKCVVVGDTLYPPELHARETHNPSSEAIFLAPC